MRSDYRGAENAYMNALLLRRPEWATSEEGRAHVDADAERALRGVDVVRGLDEVVRYVEERAARAAQEEEEEES